MKELLEKAANYAAEKTNEMMTNLIAKAYEDGYRDDFFRKLRLYNSIGLFIGKNFICTFEDKKHPFDFATHRKMFEELLLK